MRFSPPHAADLIKYWRGFAVLVALTALLTTATPALADPLSADDGPGTNRYYTLQLERIPGGVRVLYESDIVAELLAQDEQINQQVTLPDGTVTLVNAHVPATSPDGFDALPLLASAVDGTSVHLIWDSAGSGAEYTVLRDGLPIATTPATRFIDVDATPGVVNEYTVDAAVDPANFAFQEPSWLQWGTMEAEGDSMGDDDIPSGPATPSDTTRTVGTQESEDDGPRVVTMAMSVFVPSSASLAGLHEAQSEMAGILTHTSRMHHTAFIPMAKVSKADTFACLRQWYGKQFRGDDRSYSATATRFRTRLQANIYWSDRRVTKTRIVRNTVLLNEDGSVHSSKNAGTDNMEVYYGSMTSTSVRLRFVHSKGNPYCANTGGQIKYEWSGTIYSNGTYSISGEHRKAPSHEIYLRRTDSSSWHTVYRRPHESFSCLVFLACATYKISANNGIY